MKIIIIILLLLSPTLVLADEIGEIPQAFAKASTQWAEDTLMFPFRAIGSLLGKEGNPRLNENYSTSGKHGFFSQDEEYKYNQWGVY